MNNSISNFFDIVDIVDINDSDDSDDLLAAYLSL
jgi:hypothetical protein